MDAGGADTASKDGVPQCCCSGGKAWLRGAAQGEKGTSTAELKAPSAQRGLPAVTWVLTRALGGHEIHMTETIQEKLGHSYQAGRKVTEQSN